MNCVTTKRLEIDRDFAQQLQLSPLVLSDLTHRIGHEIGNPLTSIISLASLLERFGREQTNEGAEIRYAQSIIGEAWKVGSIVEKLVLLVSQRDLRFESSDIRLLLQKACSRLRSRSALPVDEVVIRISPEAPKEFLLDFDQCITVLAELLQNALRVSSLTLPPDVAELHPVMLEVRYADQMLEITVRNPIAKPLNVALAELPQPLVRGDESVSGVGIGLTTAATVAVRHEGSLHLSELHDADGQYFFAASLRIPLTRTTTSSHVDTTNSPLRFLIIEDEQAISSAIDKILKLAFTGKQEITCECASGEQALSILATGEIPDVILCDLELVTCHGSTIFESIRRAHPEALRGFAFMTGGSIPEQYNSVPFLQKPFEPEELLRLITHLLDTKPPSA